MGSNGLRGDSLPGARTSLRHHYIAYRAFVRAKISCLRCRQGDPLAGGEARHLHAGALTLVVIGGLPGTGKSALADTLADRLGFTVLTATGSARNWSASRLNRNLRLHTRLASTAGPGPSAPTKSCFTGPRSCSRTANQ